MRAKYNLKTYSVSTYSFDLGVQGIDERCGGVVKYVLNMCANTHGNVQHFWHGAIQLAIGNTRGTAEI